MQIPSFSVAKKGGGGTESFYRSQGGARLPIIVSGGNLHGGCGGRMDTLLTYVILQNYNSIKVIKGGDSMEKSIEEIEAEIAEKKKQQACKEHAKELAELEKLEELDERTKLDDDDI